MGIFILSLVIISYNYFSILTSQGNINRNYIVGWWCQTTEIFSDEKQPVFSEFESFMMAGGIREFY